MRQILLVEDEKEVREMMVDLLETMGYEVDAVVNGKEAVEYLGMKEFDLVITDMLMPVMGGRELVLHIRAKEKWKHLPILMYSAYIEVKDVMDLLQLGVTYFLNKPTEAKELKEYIERSFK